MKAKKLPVITHMWDVSGVIPNPDQVYPNYGENFRIGVEADSMEKALEVTRSVYGNATFFSCHHRGEVHLRA